jgi:geranylgeranyl pyrophosphate synthase
VDVGQYARTVIKPLREITDRGGKSWRSYAAVACCDLVGGDAYRMLKWLAVPELFHIGSLIVDDVQDKSPIRRGGPSAHEIYGEPLAINAGTAAYFLGEIFMSDLDLTDTERLQIYTLYFETLRATHAGQALDIAGLGELMPSVVESGDGSLLERRLLAIHRLKSAVPARSLAMIGAIIGKGTESQVNALGDFFEMLGLAFQIVDDTLNLRGFENNLKVLGEDVGQGKITMPVAKAMSRLSHADRQQLWTLVASKPHAQAVRAEAIALIHDCGALDACERHAHELVETGWHKLDPLVEDSTTKVMLRAFSWYVLERHF